MTLEEQLVNMTVKPILLILYEESSSQALEPNHLVQILLCHLLALQSQGTYLASLCLSFSICKMGVTGP